MRRHHRGSITNNPDAEPLRSPGDQRVDRRRSKGGTESACLRRCVFVGLEAIVEGPSSAGNCTEDPDITRRVPRGVTAARCGCGFQAGSNPLSSPLQSDSPASRNAIAEASGDEDAIRTVVSSVVASARKWQPTPEKSLSSMPGSIRTSWSEGPAARALLHALLQGWIVVVGFDRYLAGAEIQLSALATLSEAKSELLYLVP